MKSILKKLGIIAGLHILGFFIVGLGGIPMEDNPDSVIGGILISVGSILSIVTFVSFIIVLVKGIANHSFSKKDSKHLQYEQSQFADTNYSYNTNYQYNKVPVGVNSYNSIKNENDLNWPLLIVLTFLIPPIGVYFTIKKIIVENEENYYKNGTKLSIIGGVLLVFALLSLGFPIVNFVYDRYMSEPVCYGLILSGLFLGFAIMTLVSGLFIRHIGYVNDRIVYYITVERITNIDELSKILNIKRIKLIEKVTQLIYNGYLRQAYYYPYDNEIIVNGISKKIAKKCKSCAATTVIYSNDKDFRCVYCGAKL